MQCDSKSAGILADSLASRSNHNADSVFNNVSQQLSSGAEEDKPGSTRRRALLRLLAEALSQGICSHATHLLQALDKLASRTPPAGARSAPADASSWQVQVQPSAAHQLLLLLLYCTRPLLLARAAAAQAAAHSVWHGTECAGCLICLCACTSLPATCHLLAHAAACAGLRLLGLWQVLPLIAAFAKAGREELLRLPHRPLPAACLPQVWPHTIWPLACHLSACCLWQTFTCAETQCCT